MRFVKDTARNRNRIAALHDALMAALSFVLAVYIRLGEELFYLSYGYLYSGTLLFTLVCVTVFSSLRLYRGLWRYASMQDMIVIVKGVTWSVLIFAVIMFLINRLENVPRSLFIINWMLLIAMLGGPRFIYRAWRDRTLLPALSLHEHKRIPVLLIGANDRSEQFIRELARDAHATYEAVGIIDDDKMQQGRTIHRVPIYGNSEMMPHIVHKLTRKGMRPQKIILTTDAAGASVRRLLDMADGLGIPLARLPRLSEFKHKLGEQQDIQAIAVEDLLGRTQNVLNREDMHMLVQGKKALITGAGGTIGGELARQVAQLDPSEIILVENGEFNLYQIERELRGAFPDLPLTAVLCDVRDARHIDQLFNTHRPRLVFHAAAIKHVPLSESNIEEAVLTNVFGTRHVAEACRFYGADVMVMISTDKAVNPTNVMGASKRLAESFCQALGASERGRQDTRFITVRFGNVLGSTGSVVPLFQEQLRCGGPLTVTHPDMTRYFMTVREAVELVIQAAVLGTQMEDRKECIFVLDMGQPVRILDLALQMIRLAGLRAHEDIKITYTGLRPGEKLYEELFHFSENAVKTSHASIFLASPRATDMASLRKGMDKLYDACQHRQTEDALQLLKKLVPEFTPMQS